MICKTDCICGIKSENTIPIHRQITQQNQEKFRLPWGHLGKQKRIFIKMPKQYSTATTTMTYMVAIQFCLESLPPTKLLTAGKMTNGREKAGYRLSKTAQQKKLICRTWYPCPWAGQLWYHKIINYCNIISYNIIMTKHPWWYYAWLYISYGLQPNKYRNERLIDKGIYLQLVMS